MKTFSIGQRVSHKGFKGTICSSLIQVTYPAGAGFNKTSWVYLVLFDRFKDGSVPEFTNHELGYNTIGAMPVNEMFLEAVIA
jgi:hypothetical protein